ncbi:hypothetical protein [Pedobacter nyackensis]|uniref:Uncharacterized protein n=1 Tax=Pedobacter nyackensis TaxID=475255 RepID=A0A1W2EK33_9SPHI|nr:hypothetical protein [Pedobacter nyackensis]SMD10101.1 hypothetical protein SAMN04488101_11334 [Pedobacter nyackensis]
MKKQEKPGHDTDKALAKAGSVPPPNKKELKTDEPLSEKDEVKQAEEEQRKRMRSENS